MLGTNTSAAFTKFAWTTASLANRAMTIFVSSRNLPVISVDLFAILFDGLVHQSEIVRGYLSCKIQQVFSRPANRLGQGAGEVKDLDLLLYGQLIKLIDKLLLN